MSKPVEIKTKENEASVSAFIQALPDAQQREDALAITAMMQRLSGEDPKMWGTAIIGFGSLIYKSPKTGREVAWFKIGFSPRKANLSFHLVLDIQAQAEALARLGKHKTGVGCLYIKKLADVDTTVLEQLIMEALTGK
jgi:hypothetical protein